MDTRYSELLDTGRRKITRESGQPVVLVVFDFDELAYFSAAIGDFEQRKEFVALLRDLVPRGRAAGIIVVAATQRPSADIIPTSLRDLFGYRWAFRCTTDASSDVILGTAGRSTYTWVSGCSADLVSFGAPDHGLSVYFGRCRYCAVPLLGPRVGVGGSPHWRVVSRSPRGQAVTAASTLDPRSVEEIVRRAERPDFDRWTEQVARCGHCARPIRLRGRIEHRSTSGRRVAYTTDTEADQVLLVRCGNRRAACPSCSYEYAGDMWQLLYAGAAGGRKGVPESIRSHPLPTRPRHTVAVCARAAELGHGDPW